MTIETRTALVERLREAEQCFINLADNSSDGMLERAEAVSYAIAALDAAPPSLPTAREVLLERAIQTVLDYDANTDILANTGLEAVLLAALSSPEPPSLAEHKGRMPTAREVMEAVRQEPVDLMAALKKAYQPLCDHKFIDSNQNPMPLLEVGDWIQADGRIGCVTGPGDGPAAVRATTSPFYVLLKEINEVRKADGACWLRTSEPPSPPLRAQAATKLANDLESALRERDEHLRLLAVAADDRAHVAQALDQLGLDTERALRDRDEQLRLLEHVTMVIRSLLARTRT